MTTDARERLRRQLIADEGVVLHAYQDSLGFWTIGCGRMIDKRRRGGISYVEALYLLDNDISRCIRELTAAFEWFPGLDPVRQTILVAMLFNMGLGNKSRGLKSFRNTLAAIAGGRYQDAARGMRRSLWARQVGKRAERLATMMETGAWL